MSSDQQNNVRKFANDLQSTMEISMSTLTHDFAVPKIELAVRAAHLFSKRHPLYMDKANHDYSTGIGLATSRNGTGAIPRRPNPNQKHARRLGQTRCTQSVRSVRLVMQLRGRPAGKRLEAVSAVAVKFAARKCSSDHAKPG